jgi:uncharacterized damage-inducible protein DinB
MMMPAPVREKRTMDSKLLEFLRDAFIASYEQEMPVTTKVMLAVPEERKTYRPDSRSMTAEDLVWHIASDEVWFQTSVLQGKFERGNYKTHPSTILGITEWYKSHVDELLPRIRALTPEELVRTVPFFGLEFPAVICLSFLVQHSIHHRGQLSTYLRSMGGVVPNIYGPSAEDPDAGIVGPFERYAARLAELCK